MNLAWIDLYRNEYGIEIHKWYLKYWDDYVLCGWNYYWNYQTGK